MCILQPPGHCLRLLEGLTPITLAWLPMNLGEQEALGWEQPGVCAKRPGQCTTGRGLPVPLNHVGPPHSANPNLAPQACFIPHTPRSRLQFTPRSSQEPTPLRPSRGPNLTRFSAQWILTLPTLFSHRWRGRALYPHRSPHTGLS